MRPVDRIIKFIRIYIAKTSSPTLRHPWLRPKAYRHIPVPENDVASSTKFTLLGLCPKPRGIFTTMELKSDRAPNQPALPRSGRFPYRTSFSRKNGPTGLSGALRQVEILISSSVFCGKWMTQQLHGRLSVKCRMVQPITWSPHVLMLRTCPR